MILRRDSCIVAVVPHSTVALYRLLRIKTHPGKRFLFHKVFEHIRYIPHCLPTQRLTPITNSHCCIFPSLKRHESGSVSASPNSIFTPTSLSSFLFHLFFSDPPCLILLGIYLQKTIPHWTRCRVYEKKYVHRRKEGGSVWFGLFGAIIR